MDEIMTATELKCAVGWQLCEKTVCGQKTLKRTLCLIPHPIPTDSQ